MTSTSSATGSGSNNTNPQYSSPFTYYLTTIAELLYTYATVLLSSIVSFSETVFTTIIKYISKIFNTIFNLLDNTIFEYLYKAIKKFLDYFFFIPLSYLTSPFKELYAQLKKLGITSLMAGFLIYIIFLVFYFDQNNRGFMKNLSSNANFLVSGLFGIFFVIYAVINFFFKTPLLILYSMLYGLENIDSIDGRDDKNQTLMSSIVTVLLLLSYSLKKDDAIIYSFFTILMVITIGLGAILYFNKSDIDISPGKLNTIKEMQWFKTQFYGFNMISAKHTDGHDMTSMDTIIKYSKVLYYLLPICYFFNSITAFKDSILQNFVTFIHPANSLSDIRDAQLKFCEKCYLSNGLLGIFATIQIFFSSATESYINSIMKLDPINKLFVIISALLVIGFIFLKYYQNYKTQIYNYFIGLYALISLPTIYKILSSGGGGLNGALSLAIGVVSLIIMYISYGFSITQENYVPTPEQMSDKTFFDVLFIIYIGFLAAFMNVQLLASDFNSNNINSYMMGHFIFVIALMYFAVSFKVKMRNRIDKAPGDLDLTNLQDSNTYVTTDVPVAVHR